MYTLLVNGISQFYCDTYDEAVKMGIELGFLKVDEFGWHYGSADMSITTA